MNDSKRGVFARLTPTHVALLAWLGISLFLLYRGWAGLPAKIVSDPDDALRLVQVRDLIAGQGWWDVTQHRINPLGGGGLMHWSRIVDAPLALGILALRPWLGQSMAETVTMALWPLVTLLALFLVAARAFSLLGDRAVAALAAALIATDYMILLQFGPLRIDHHGWQILLSLAVLYGMLRPPTARHGVIAGCAAAVILIISLEGMVPVAAAAGVLALLWAWSGDEREYERLSWFMIALAVAAPALQLVTRGPGAIVQHWCDAMSLPYFAALIVGASGITLIGALAQKRPLGRGARFALLAVAALASAAILFSIEPACTKGPYGMLDPIVRQYWFDNVREGRPIWQRIDGTFAALLTPIVVGVIGTAFAFRAERTRRREWLTLVLMLAAIVPYALFVTRGAGNAHLFVLPGTAWLIVALWRWSRRLPWAALRVAVTPLIVLFTPLVSAGVAVALLNAQTAHASKPGRRETAACWSPAAMVTLNSYPAQLLMTPLDLGPHVLMRTHHSVTATGHHRNNRIMAQVLTAFTSPAEQAEPLVRSSGATMIVLCPGMYEVMNLAKAPGDTLVRRLLDNRPPEWLKPIPPIAGDVLRMWVVMPRAGRHPNPAVPEERILLRRHGDIVPQSGAAKAR